MFEFKKEDCEISKDFKGSIFEKMGNYTKYLCPKCKSHLVTSMICLNGCHLPEQWQINFRKKMQELAEKKEEEECV